MQSASIITIHVPFCSVFVTELPERLPFGVPRYYTSKLPGEIRDRNQQKLTGNRIQKFVCLSLAIIAFIGDNRSY